MEMQGLPFDKNRFAIGAIIVWLLIAIGINLFVITNSSTFTDAVIKGALFGLIVYGVFNGTNYSIFRSWGIKTSLIDTCWGIFICGVVSGTIFQFNLSY